jgi:predicted dienelactone hydrolase
MRLLLLLPLAGCLFDDDPNIEVPPYDFPGPWTPGTFAVDLVGSDGTPLTAQVWYPAAVDDGALHTYVLQLTRTALDKPAAECLGARPVLAYSHGSGGLRYQSLFLTELLASHGYIVIAPDHTDNTTFDEDEDAYGRVALRRPQDLADAYDVLADDERLAGCIDRADGYAVAGHSFGGWTAAAAAGAVIDPVAIAAVCGTSRGWLCQILDEIDTAELLDLSDPRIWASVAMAPSSPYTFGDEGAGMHDTPSFILGGDDDTLTPWETDQVPLYEALTARPRALAQVVGASHYTFSEACLLFPTDEYCRGDIDLTEAHTLISAMTLAFLERIRGVDEGTADAWLPPDDARVVWTSVE